MYKEITRRVQTAALTRP